MSELPMPLVTEENPCLPLAVNIVSQYWGVNIPMSKAAERARKYQTRGSIFIEGMELAEQHGLNVGVLHADVSKLRKTLDMGVPPIIILPGVADTLQHASVITGYDQEVDTFTHYIPKREADGSFHVGVIPSSRLDMIWAEDSRLAIIISDGVKPETDAAVRMCFEAERHNLLGERDAAVQTLKSAIQLSPDDFTAHLMLGGILNEAGSSDCTKHYERCIKLNGRAYLAYRGMGNHHLKQKAYGDAEQYYSAAIDINPERFAPIYKNRGIARIEMGRSEQARSDLEKYLELLPSARDAGSIRGALTQL